MSKSIIIQEAGLPQSLTVDALRLKKLGGGSEDWLPADGKNLVELDIGGSGTYRASDYNAYGIAVARVTPKYGGGATSKAAVHDFTKKHTPFIKEGGKSRNFSATMLKANLQGGGTCLWIPKMDVELKNKYISKSGVYTAKADNCFGFDQITVSGVDMEIIQDDDGDDVARITDGGVITDKKLPSSIRITVLPQKVDYTEGETIDYTGLVVHAYTRSGIDLGAVPLDELVLSVTTAHGADSFFTAESDLNTGLNQPIYFVKSADSYDSYFTAGGIADLYNRRNIVLASPSKPAGRLYSSDGTIITEYEGAQYTHDGKTVYFVGVSSSTEVVIPSNTWIKPNVAPSAQKVAWTIIYGNINAQKSKQTLPVQWPRPGDGAVLETSFDIQVNPAA